MFSWKLLFVNKALLASFIVVCGGSCFGGISMVCGGIVWLLTLGVVSFSCQRLRVVKILEETGCMLKYCAIIFFL